MAKNKNAETEPEAVPSPNTVNVTITVPKSIEIALHKETGAAVTRDMTKLDARAIEHLFMYGLGRFNRDGCTPDTHEGEGDAKRELTKDERAAAAIKASDDKWSRLVAGTLRERSGATADPILAELRLLTIMALRKKGMALKAIGKLTDRAAIEGVLKPYEGALAKLTARAEAIVKERAANDIEI